MNKEFIFELGKFHGAWATIDVELDLAISKSLNLSYEDAQMVTAGMQFGSKIRILYNIIKRGNHPNKSKIIDALNTLRNKVKRNIVAHSYMITDEKTVTFIERSGAHSYEVTKHEYTLESFKDLVKLMTQTGIQLFEAVELSNSELQKFGEAAFKSTKS